MLIANQLLGPSNTNFRVGRKYIFREDDWPGVILIDLLEVSIFGGFSGSLFQKLVREAEVTKSQGQCGVKSCQKGFLMRYLYLFPDQ